MFNPDPPHTCRLSPWKSNDTIKTALLVRSEHCPRVLLGSEQRGGGQDEPRSQRAREKVLENLAWESQGLAGGGHSNLTLQVYSNLLFGP